VLKKIQILLWNVKIRALCSFKLSVNYLPFNRMTHPRKSELLKSFTDMVEHHRLLTSMLSGQYLLQLDVTSQKALLKQLLD
jgi:hypothetical protein